MTDVSHTIVDKLYEDYEGLSSFLSSAGETSHSLVVRDAFQRNLAVAAASLFEQFIKDAINDFAYHRSNGDAAIIKLVQVGVTDRGYHQMFDWNQNTPSSFFGYFGKISGSLGHSMREQCAGDNSLKESARAFLELGRLRNSLVHNNFAFVPMNVTVEECFALFQLAKPFVSYVLNRLGKAE